MILARDFVYVHQPKTGGTFVTRMLERLGEGLVDVNKHGTCAEIPASHRGLPIVATARNPYDRYVSQYEFGWWREHPPREWFDMESVRAKYPRWPEVSFAEFVDASIDAFRKLGGSPLPPADQPGFHTEQFVRYYFRDPQAVYRRIDDAYIAARAFERDMYPVRFLRTEDLNRQLHDFLVDRGRDRADVAFILNQEKIVPDGSTRTGEKPWRAYYTPELKARVRHRERLLFAMFPEYDR